MESTRVGGRARALAMVLALGIAPGLDAQQPARWRLVEEWRVGGAPDGPHFLGDPRGLGATKDGGVVVLEYKDQQLHFLDARGQPVRTVGRKGAGPGEFQQANGLRVAPNGEVIINDPSNNRFTVLGPTGDFVRSVRPQPWGFGAFWDAHFNKAGRLDEYVSVRAPGATSPTRARRVWREDLSAADTVMPAVCPGVPPDPVLYFRYTYPNGRGYMNAQYPFIAPRSYSGVFASDGSVWKGRHPDYRVIERTTFGQCGVRATIQLRGSAVPVPRAQYDSAVGRISRMSAGQGDGGPDPAKVPRALPFFELMYVDGADRLWIARFKETNLKFVNDVPLGDSRFEVFDASGALLAEADIPVLMTDRPAVITDDHVYAFTRDADGLFYLVSLRIVKN